jgi:hypothetical protein
LSLVSHVLLLFRSFSLIFWSLSPPPPFCSFITPSFFPLLRFPAIRSSLSSHTNRKYQRSISALFHLALEISSPDRYKNNILLVFFNRNQQKRRKCSQLYLRQIAAGRPPSRPAPNSNNFINNTKQPDFLTV